MSSFKIDVSTLSAFQRSLRSNIRSLFIVASVTEMRQAMNYYPDSFSRACLREMLSTCVEQGVENFGETV